MIPSIEKYQEFLEKKKGLTNEGHSEMQNYMFFANISNIRRM